MWENVVVLLKVGLIDYLGMDLYYDWYVENLRVVLEDCNIVKLFNDKSFYNF